MHRLVFLRYFIALLFVGNLQAQQEFNYYDTLRGTNSKFRACYDVTYYDLNLTIVPDQKYIEGYNAIHYKVLTDFDTLQLDLFNNYIIDSLTWNDEQIRYRTDSNTIFVLFDDQVQKQGQAGIIKVYYSGSPIEAKNAPWDGGFVWSTDNSGEQWAGVACEGIGASLWWPCKDHLSDEPDSMGIHLTVPANLDCISNGRLRTIEDKKDYKTYNWDVSYPINNYNVTFYLGNYELIQSKYSTKDGEQLNISYYPLKHNLEKAQKYFEGQVVPMLSAYENYFGPYPFLKDGYKLVEAPYWGMEHQTAIAYGNKYQINDFNFDFIIIHESAHEYWGNSVSVSDHGEMWIHEAFATYMESLFLEFRDSLSAAEKYLAEQKLRIKNEVPILGPTGVNFDRWPDADMYYKGSWILHTLRSCTNNDSLWFGTLKMLYKTFQLRQINTNDILSFFDENLNFKASTPLNYYLNDTTNPRLVYKLIKHTKKKSTLSYKWINVPEDFSLPILFKYSNGSSSMEIVESHWKSKELKKINYIEIPEKKYLIDVQQLTE